MGNNQAPATHFNGPGHIPRSRQWPVESVLRYPPAHAGRHEARTAAGSSAATSTSFGGSDYFFTTAAGLDGTSIGNVPRWGTSTTGAGGDAFRYGFAMPQLYAETDYGRSEDQMGPLLHDHWLRSSSRHRQLLLLPFVRHAIRRALHAYRRIGQPQQ